MLLGKSRVPCCSAGAGSAASDEGASDAASEAASAGDDAFFDVDNADDAASFVTARSSPSASMR